MLLQNVFCGVVFCALISSPGVPAQCKRHGDPKKWERGQFVEVAKENRAEVSAQFLSQAGCGEQMLQGLEQLGARIDFGDKTSGYALVTIPREKLLDTLALPGIASAC